MGVAVFATPPRVSGLRPVRRSRRGRGSDPSLMVGVVLLLVANTLVIAALVAAVVWIVA